MKERLDTEGVRLLFNAVMSLKNMDECYDFFEDICTVNEVLSLSQRLEVAQMLRNGKTYVEIEQSTGASTATISRVKRSLVDGNQSYDKIFDRLK